MHVPAQAFGCARVCFWQVWVVLWHRVFVWFDLALKWVWFLCWFGRRLCLFRCAGLGACVLFRVCVCVCVYVCVCVCVCVGGGD